MKIDDFSVSHKWRFFDKHKTLFSVLLWLIQLTKKSYTL